MLVDLHDVVEFGAPVVEVAENAEDLLGTSDSDVGAVPPADEADEGSVVLVGCRDIEDDDIVLASLDAVDGHH